MFCSTIIATVGRPTLDRAVESILDQPFLDAEYEIIVVNDSGSPLPPANWQLSDRVRQIMTNRRERCVARNAGAAIARGKFLHFLDDDDWLLPEAYQSFWVLASTELEAVWLYGGSQLVDRAGNPIIQLKHTLSGNCTIQAMAGEWLPLQSSLINAETFFSVGGFNPLIPGIEDVDLLRQITFQGEIAGFTEPVAAITMGVEGSLTNYPHAQELGREARERLFGHESAFQRMRSAASSGFWHGRIVRAYLTSAIWNLRRALISNFVSRLFYGFSAALLSLKYVWSADFWGAITRPYESQTFLDGFNSANRQIERREI